MEFVDVMKQFRRICSSKQDCAKCPIHLNVKTDEIFCINKLKLYPVECEKAIMDWAKENPEETWLDKLKKAIPTAEPSDIVLRNCPRAFFGMEAPGWEGCMCRERQKCEKCWGWTEEENG